MLSGRRDNETDTEIFGPGVYFLSTYPVFLLRGASVVSVNSTLFTVGHLGVVVVNDARTFELKPPGIGWKRVSDFKNRMHDGRLDGTLQSFTRRVMWHWTCFPPSHVHPVTFTTGRV